MIVNVIFMSVNSHYKAFNAFKAIKSIIIKHLILFYLIKSLVSNLEKSREVENLVSCLEK